MDYEILQWGVKNGVDIPKMNDSDIYIDYNNCIYADHDGTDITDLMWAWVFNTQTEHSQICELFKSQTINLDTDFETILKKASEKCNFCGDYTIHSAVMHGDIEILKILLVQPRINVNVINANGETPLHLACSYKDLDMIERLISRGAQVNKVDNSGMVPLHVALAKYHTESAKYLLEHDAYVDFYLSKRLKLTPLHWAITQDFQPMVELLIKFGANVNAKDSNKCSPAYKAVVLNDAISLSYLIQHKANVNETYAKGRSLLHLSCSNRKDACTKLLLEAGVSPNKGDDNKMNAFHFIAKSKKTHMVQMLVMYGCDINSRDKYMRSPLDIAILNNNTNMVVQLLNYGACTKQITYSLRKAINYRYKDVIRVLLNRGVDVDIQDKFNKTPLLIAVENADLEMVDFLLNCGANPNARGKSNWPVLIEAIYQKKPEIVKKLLDGGADQNLMDNKGRTPLFHARRTMYKDVIDILVKNRNQIICENCRIISFNKSI